MFFENVLDFKIATLIGMIGILPLLQSNIIMIIEYGVTRGVNSKEFHTIVTIHMIFALITLSMVFRLLRQSC